MFTIKTNVQVPSGTIGFSLVQRKWANLFLGEDVHVRPYSEIPECLCTVVLEADFLAKKRYV